MTTRRDGHCFVRRANPFRTTRLAVAYWSKLKSLHLHILNKYGFISVFEWGPLVLVIMTVQKTRVYRKYNNSNQFQLF